MSATARAGLCITGSRCPGPERLPLWPAALTGSHLPSLRLTRELSEMCIPAQRRPSVDEICLGEKVRFVTPGTTARRAEYTVEMKRRGVFLDLNGTLVEPLKQERLEELTLIPGVVQAIRKLTAGG